MRLQQLLLLAFSFFTLINAIPTVNDVEDGALVARAKKPKGGKPKSRPHPHPKPLPKGNRPKPQQQPHQPKEVKCDPISKYSESWFIANACKRPQKSKCLFYTRGLSKTARAYAKKHGMITIWDMWSSDLYDNSITKKNKLRCIMQHKGDGGQMRTYFAHMSGAMAAMCDVFATVMDKNINANNKNFDTVTKTGIWYKTEFPQLYLGGLGKRVTQIEAISPDGNTAFTYWTQGGHPRSERRDFQLNLEANSTASDEHEFDHDDDHELDMDFDFDDAEWDDDSDSWTDDEDDHDVGVDFYEEGSLEARAAKAKAPKKSTYSRAPSCPLKPGTTDQRAGQFDAGGSHALKW